MANKSSALIGIILLLVVVIVISFIFLTIGTKIPPNKPAVLTNAQNVAYDPIRGQYMTWSTVNSPDYSRQRIPAPGDYTYF